MNSTRIEMSVIPGYDQNGAIIYTIVTLLFYSLSLFCSLILNIDPDDQCYEQKWSVYHNSKTKQTLQSTRVDILNTLADQSLREKYWRIYYDNDEFELRSHKFLSAELKRLSMVSQRMKELNNEQLKQTNKHEELFELNQIVTNHTPQPSPNPSNSPFLFKFRRTRSSSVQFVSYTDSSIRRSLNILSETPLCKPPITT